MPRVVFELTIPVFDRAKTFHALDCAAVVIGGVLLEEQLIPWPFTKFPAFYELKYLGSAHKTPPCAVLNSIHTLPSYSLWMCFNIMLPMYRVISG
jgi:hypothetical protein